jgi:hypothetical protein
MATDLDIGGIRDAIADLLRRNSSAGIEVMPRWDGVAIPSRMPCVMVQVDGVAYHQASVSGMAEVRLRLTAWTSFTEDGALLLDRMMSTGPAAAGDSIHDAIQSDRLTLGGTGLGGLVKELAIVEPVTAPRSVMFDVSDSSRAWSAEWIVTVYQSHKRS